MRMLRTPSNKQMISGQGEILLSCLSKIAHKLSNKHCQIENCAKSSESRIVGHADWLHAGIER